MDFRNIINTGLINIGSTIGYKLSINSIMSCSNPDNLIKLTQGATSFRNANITLNYVLVIFLLLINNLVNLAGSIFSVIFMIVLFLISLGIYYYYDSDYKSKKDSINQCLNDNYSNTNSK